MKKYKKEKIIVNMISSILFIVVSYVGFTIYESNLKEEPYEIDIFKDDFYNKENGLAYNLLYQNKHTLSAILTVNNIDPEKEIKEIKYNKLLSYETKIDKFSKTIDRKYNEKFDFEITIYYQNQEIDDKIIMESLHPIDKKYIGKEYYNLQKYSSIILIIGTLPERSKQIEETYKNLNKNIKSKNKNTVITDIQVRVKKIK